MNIKLIKSTFYNEIETKIALCEFIMKSEQLSIGTQCKKFENDFSVWQNRKYSVMFNSGSSANLALIQALLNNGSIHKGDKVGFSGITWATNVMPLMQLGLVPIPVDIELHTLNCSLENIVKSQNEHGFKILFLTNLLGFSDDIEKIQDFCRESNILLLEDNCESLGSVYNGVKLGNFSFGSTFSFFVGHHLSTIEGGMVVTDDKTLYDELLKVRAHGWDRHLSHDSQMQIRKEYGITPFYAKYTFYDLGYNLRPTEINGFLGVNQLAYLDEMIAKRQKNFIRFQEILSYTSDFFPLGIDMDTVSNFAMPLIARTKEIKDKYINLLDKAGIEIRPIVGGLMYNQPFFTKYIDLEYDLPNSQLIHDNGFYFGNNPEMTKEDIDYVLSVFKNA